MSTKNELLALVDEKFDNFIAHMESRSSEDFVKVYKEGKWSNGQHLDHVRKTTRALNKGLSFPKLALWWKFGKKKTAEMNYEQVKAKYYKKLGGGVKAPRSVQPDAITLTDRDRVMNWLKEEQTTLKKNLSSFSEKQLGQYQLPHPALGKFSIREMIYWCTMHTEHHLKLMIRDNGE